MCYYHKPKTKRRMIKMWNDERDLDRMTLFQLTANEGAGLNFIVGVCLILLSIFIALGTAYYKVRDFVRL